MMQGFTGERVERAAASEAHEIRRPPTTHRGPSGDTAARRAARSRFGAWQRTTARLVLAMFVGGGAAGPAAAGPTDTALGPAETTYGSGEFTINTPTHTEYTQGTSQAIVDWGVDIQQGPDHTLGFRQEAGFAVLNRSPGVRASNFYGTLTCDATCIFANEAGIYFHDGSFVDVGQLIAGAGTMSTADFIGGQYLFTDVLGEVVNHGHMRGDSITLLGQRVANFGYVETPGGSFAMLAGGGILLRDHDSPIVIESPLPPPTEGDAGFGDTPAVENAGTIDAGDGSVRLAAGDMLSFAIRQSGEIRARRIALEGGDGGLVEVTGALDASDAGSGHTGGEIDVLGDYVAIAGDARLDASGSAGGGRIRVGGDRQGQGETRTARAAYVGPDAEIRADALDAGDGGEVIVFAEDSARVYGQLSARGGEDGGDGGFVETSGKRFIDVRRAPEVHARSGLLGDLGGEWLIDPNDIEIVATPTECGDKPVCLDDGLSEEILSGPNSPVLQPTVDDSKITAGVIAGALQSGSNVTILTETVATVPGDQVGNITVSADIVLDEEQSPGPGTDVALLLRAAQNIIIDGDIRVQRRAPSSPDEARGASDLTLDLLLLSADTEQRQAPAPSDQTPNRYLGEIDIRGAIDTAGGDVAMQGFGVTLAPTSSIATHGGNVDVESVLGDILIRGAIDTSSNVLDETTNEPLRGGDVTLRAEVVRRPVTGASDSPTEPVGGNIAVLDHILTGGGDVDLTAEGGDLTLGGTEAATIASGGGDVVLRAVEVTLPPVTSSDVTSPPLGGRIGIGPNGRILSDGGLVDVGVLDLDTFLGAREIVLQGEIDTRPLDSDAAFDPDLPTDTAWFDGDAMDRVGGAVFFNTGGDGAAVRILERDPLDPTAPQASIRTNGAGFDSLGEGTFRIEAGLIDTTFAKDPADRAEGLFLDSSIAIEHDGGVEILARPTGQTALRAEESLAIRAGVTGGVGDLVFDDGGTFSGAPVLQANTIALSAGDAEAPDGGTTARVVLGSTVLSGFANASPVAFALEQDADLAANAVIDNLPADIAALERLTLSAWDGVIDIADPAALTIAGLDLSLNAGSDIVVPESFTPPTDALESLDIEIVEDFRLEQRLASWLSGAAAFLRVGAGAAEDDAAPSLTIAGSSDPLAPMELFASGELVLQGGQRGEGDLAFEGETVLGAPRITLQAGNGDATGTARVRSAGLEGVTFEDGQGGQTRAFTLRQDAAIEPDVIPDASQFIGGVDGVEYTLRADGTGSGIILDDTSPARLANTDLRLFADGPIDLSDLADDALTLSRLEIGGLGSFQYTRALDDKYQIVNPSGRELVIRAGLARAGVLSFEGGLTITADDIRLVAGDGVGGAGAGGSDGSRVSLTPGSGAAPVFQKAAGVGPDTFLLRQDLDVRVADLPDLATHFGGAAPGRLAVRSDDGQIVLDTFSTEPLLDAASEVILSAQGIDLLRSDGEDLAIDALFGDGAGGPVGSIEMRADSITWSSTADGVQPLSEVLPGTTVRLAAFDGPTDDERLQSPPAPFDFDAAIDEAPEVIDLVQDGDIDAGNLIDPQTQLGTGTPGTATLNDYILTSRFGGIEVRPQDLDQAGLVALILDGVDELPGLARTVRFLDDAGVGFAMDALVVETPFGWTLQNASTNGTALTIRATEFINLLAGLGNPATPGTGNLSFGPGVTLQSRAIVLQAGDDPQNSLRDVLPPTDPHAVVDTTHVTLLLDEDPTDPDSTDTIVRIFQHGTLTDDSGAADPGAGSSLIIGANQIRDAADPAQQLVVDELQLSSLFGDVEITDFGTGQSVLPGTSVTLVAGSGGGETGGTVRLLRSDGGDLNLTVDSDGNEVFDALRLFGRRIELSAADGTTDPTYVRAAGTNLLILGPLVGVDAVGNPIFTSPDAVVVEQNADFLEAAPDPTSPDPGYACRFGCLPEAFQLGPTGASGIDYRLVSHAGQVYVNEPLTFKVWGSNLDLVGNEPSAGQPDVIFDVRTNRALDFFLSSLTVGDDPLDTDILLRSDASDDAFGDLTIVTGGSQTYNGAVTIDGRIELTADVVEFASTIDERETDYDLKDVDSSVGPSLVTETTTSPSFVSDLVVGVVSQGRFAGDIGTASTPGQAFDRFRVNFDPTTSGTVRFGSASGGDTVVSAERIELFAVSDAATDTRASRSPLTSTIYKRGGNLTFNANTFEMGVGEKLTVQGDLAIRLAPGLDPTAPPPSATLGDLSALNIFVGRADPGNPLPTIALQRRPAGSYLARGGTVRADAGVDYVANTIDFDGRIVLTGFGANPVFGLADPRTAPIFVNPFPVLGAQASGLALQPATLDWSFSDVLPDLHPEGASRDDVSSMYFAEDLVPNPPPIEPDPWLPWQRSELTNLFVFARPLDGHEWKTWLAGAPVIDDVGRNLQAWDGRPMPVAAARLDGEDAQRAVELFEEIFGSDGGNVPALRRTLQRALDEYVRNTGARRVVGFELRRYVKNRPSSLYQAYQLLEDLDTLFAYHRGLGLTPGEYRPIQARWLDAIRPEGITTAELAEAVQPSRYVRGTDVLDIFGD